MNLYAPSELEQLQQDLPYLVETMKWVEEFLGKPHPDLGRTGAVCPFVPRAMQMRTVRLAVIRTDGVDALQLEEIVRHYRDFFLELEPQQGELAVYKAIMLIFPDVALADAPNLIDAVQQKLKPLFVEAGLMIGEFHALNESPGLHNPDFRPLRSPLPMLAIRFMAETDLPFLERESDAPELRIRYLEAYLNRWSGVIKNEKKLQHARRALANAYAERGDVPPIFTPTAVPSKCPFATVLRFFQALKPKPKSMPVPVAPKSDPSEGGLAQSNAR